MRYYTEKCVNATLKSRMWENYKYGSVRAFVILINLKWKDGLI